LVSYPELKNEATELPKMPFVINMTSITHNPQPYEYMVSEPLTPAISVSEPLTPVISVSEPLAPIITASSQQGELGPQLLLTSAQPGWHAERAPRYPQFLEIDFKNDQTIRKISFLPQDGFPSRMPGEIQIFSSKDQTDWQLITPQKAICNLPTEAGWRSILLPEAINARFLKIEIGSNCGDPEFLTLRGLNIE
jgi:hypothetical protein